MSPLGFNPQLLPQSVQKTTRAALYNEKEPGQDLSRRHDEELEAEVKFLDKLVRRSLGSFDVSPPNAKRQKLNVYVDSADSEGSPTPIAFRLVSSALPPHPISLLPAHHASIPHQRPAEDTLNEEQLRQKRAQEVAIEAEWVLEHFQAPKSPTHRTAVTKTLIPIASSVNSLQLPNLLVTERARSTVDSSTVAEREPNRVKCCPLVLVADPISNDKPQKRKRKRKHTPKDRPPPRFFRPIQEWGGRSAGYAMGWCNSWPAYGPGPHHYIRDEMRKGITLARLEEMK